MQVFELCTTLSLQHPFCLEIPFVNIGKTVGGERNFGNVYVLYVFWDKVEIELGEKEDRRGVLQDDVGEFLKFLVPFSGIAGPACIFQKPISFAVGIERDVESGILDLA